MDRELLKRQAAARALEDVEAGMRLGLGTGSTARHFIELLGERVRAGLAVAAAVPTSEATRRQAEREGIPVTTLDDLGELDLTVDGADEIAPDLTLIKGGGGALLREKIVASVSRRFVIIADETKWVSALGRFPLPIEVVPFGWKVTQSAVEDAVRVCSSPGRARLRRTGDGHPLVTDSGHWLLDAALTPIADPAALASRLNAIPGVVEHGLFVGMANTVILGCRAGVRVIEGDLRDKAGKASK